MTSRTNADVADAVTLVLPRATYAGVLQLLTRQLEHVNNGLCPDIIEGGDVRDDECPACQVLLQLDQAITAQAPPTIRREDV